MAKRTTVIIVTRPRRRFRTLEVGSDPDPNALGTLENEYEDDAKERKRKDERKRLTKERWPRCPRCGNRHPPNISDTSPSAKTVAPSGSEASNGSRTDGTTGSDGSD